MSERIKLYVEGPADLTFLHDFMLFRFRDELKTRDLKIEIDDSNLRDKLLERQDKAIGYVQGEAKTTVSLTAVDGNTGLRGKKMHENALLGMKNVVIFDADSDYDQSLKAYRKQASGVEFEAFLLPDNQSAGNLETLLEGLMAEPHGKLIADCWDDYTNCLIKTEQAYKLPGRKAFVYTYSHLTSGRGGEQERDYLNPEHWDLSAEAAEPLYGFLRGQFGGSKPE